MLDWMEALAFSTADLLGTRLSHPPAMREIDYIHRKEQPKRPVPIRPRLAGINGVVYAFDSKVLPPVTETIRIAERLRDALMGAHKNVMRDASRVSPRFSGKDAAGRPLAGHRHVFVLPYDDNGDGHVDHVLVFCHDEFAPDERLAMDRVKPLWQPQGRPALPCVPVRWGKVGELRRPSRLVRNVTPFVPARHYRRGRGPLDQWLASEIRRECEHHGLPAPVRVRGLECLELSGGRRIRWIEFHRHRKEDPSQPGYGFELQFAEDVPAPFTLGYGCHFGLGQFRAD